MNPITFPSLNTVAAFPGLYLDTPRSIPRCIWTPVLKQVLGPLPFTSWISLGEVSVDVHLDWKGQLYVGLVVKTIRTDRWLLCGVHSRLTIYHPYEDRFILPPGWRQSQTFLDGLRRTLETFVAANQDEGVWEILVRHDPHFGCVCSETVAYALCQSHPGFYRKLDVMKAIVIDALRGMVKPPPFSYHLRMWGCLWIGRAPTLGQGMGFWANQLPMPLN